MLVDDKPAYAIPDEDHKNWTASKQIWKDRSLKEVLVEVFRRVVCCFAVQPETSPSPETVVIAEYGGECSQLGRTVLCKVNLCRAHLTETFQFMSVLNLMLCRSYKWGTSTRLG